MPARSVFRFAALLSFALLSAVPLGSAAAAAPVKLKVTIDRSAIYVAPSANSQKLAYVDLDKILDSEGREGEFYKVTLEQNGLKITGFINKIAVEELSESDVERLSKEAAAPAEVVKTQADIFARIENRIGENKDLIKAQKDLPRAVESLRPIIAEVFGLDDRQKQREVACDIYYWLGVALAKSGDSSGAIQEFRNMFVVDSDFAAEATKDLFDTDVSRLVDTAKKMQKGLLISYTLSINTEPQQANVKIDGKFIGKSPITYSATSPKFTLEIEKEGFAPVKKDKFLMDPTETETIALRSLGRTVMVSSAPPGARVFLDGQDTGKVTACELPYVPYGERRIRLVIDNYTEWEQSLQVREGPGSFPVSAVLTASNYAPFQKIGGTLNKPFKFPKAIAIDVSGNIYIADETDYKVRRYDQELRTFSWGSTSLDVRKLGIPAGLAVDGQGFVYVTDFGNSCVVKFERTGKQVGRWVSNGVKERELNGPTGIAVDANNDVYVADTGNNRVVRFSSTGALKKFWGKQGTGRGQFSSPTGVAVNARNEVLIVDKGGRVQRFTPDGDYLSELGKAGVGESGLSRPQGLCLDAQGNLYVADTGNNRVQKFSPDGKLIGCLGDKGVPEGPLAGPVAVAVNDKGAVFVVEKGAHRVQEFRVPVK
jgi:DNA-binding beta-propeller fold protein YncE